MTTFIIISLYIHAIKPAERTCNIIGSTAARLRVELSAEQRIFLRKARCPIQWVPRGDFSESKNCGMCVCVCVCVCVKLTTHFHLQARWILGKTPTWCTNNFLCVYNTLHVSSTQCSSSGETNCINTASGNSHSMLVAEMCAGWKKARWSYTSTSPSPYSIMAWKETTSLLHA